MDPFAADIGEAAAASRIVAPMPGTVTRILAEPGADLPRGAPLLVLEAMKMEHRIVAPRAGTVSEIMVGHGDSIAAGTLLAVVKEDSDG